MSNSISLRGTAVVLALLAGTAQASSLTFSNVGNAGTLLFQTTWDGATLNASAAFKLTSISATAAVFDVTIANASSGPGQNALMSLGVDVVTPALIAVNDNSSFWDTQLSTVLPSFATVDLCVYASNNCKGGAIGNGMAEGGSSSFQLTLNTAGNFLTNGVTFTSPYGAKFQGVGSTGNSYEFAGCISGLNGCGGGGGDSNQVPEPGSFALAGLALLGMASALRRGRAR